MLAPLSWLKDYVDIDCTPQELQDKLFSCGFEVEQLYQVGADIEKVVVGEVLTCDPIEGTHLHLCTVNCGEHGTFQICCGADNVEAGKKFPTALVGATVLETNRDRTAVVGTAKIKKGKLRGYESDGMLCSGMELGVSEDMYPGAGYDGLLVLPADAKNGEDVKPLLGLDDWIFDIAITANRPDCQSIFGIAREVAAVLEKPVKAPALDYHESERKLEGFEVHNHAPEYCQRYISHYVYDVKISESPAWMKRRLALIGMNSISNIVDITNYVLAEIGQPMHAFDRDYLEGNQINVRLAAEGEELTTLDEEKLTLHDTNLLICDGKKPVALAGIMGGLNSEIRDTTSEVVFESAKFERANIRRSAKSVGKSTDASARYAKGVDEYSTVMGMARALHLVEELGCGTVSCTHIDANTGNSLERKQLQVSVSRVNGILGITVPDADIVRIMKNLDMEPSLEGDVLTLQVPAYRSDMEGVQDVAEEVIREYGYDHIQPTFLAAAKVTSGGFNRKQKVENKLRDVLCGTGAYECMHYSFFSPSDLDLLKLSEDDPWRHAIRIMNPISEELSLMRTTLAPSMIRAVVRNEKEGRTEGRLFEMAKVFIPGDLPLTAYPDERDHLVIAFFGKDESFYTVKGAVDLVADTLHVDFTYEAGRKTFLHPYQTAVVKYQGEEIGYLGKLGYDIVGADELRTPLYIAELDLQSLRGALDLFAKYVPLSPYPEVKRDLALVMDRDVTCAQVMDSMKSVCKNLSDIELFDVYEGAQVLPGKKSMAFTLTFTPGSEELTGEKVDKLVDKILRKLQFTMGVEIRK